MNKRKTNLLKDLKLIVDTPKRYLTSYFAELKNQIDLECQVCIGRDNLVDEEKEKAISQQLELIQEVDSFEQKCLANVEQLELPTKEQIDGIREEKELYIALHQVQKQLFMNEGMLFLDSKRFEELVQEEQGSNFGVFDPLVYPSEHLIILEDEFMVLNEKVKQILRLVLWFQFLFTIIFNSYDMNSMVDSVLRSIICIDWY